MFLVLVISLLLPMALIPIIGHGNVSLLPFLILKDAFYIPNLYNNLISIKKLPMTFIVQ